MISIGSTLNGVQITHSKQSGTTNNKTNGRRKIQLNSHQRRQLQKAVEYIPPYFNYKMELEVNPEIQRVVIKVIDRNSDKVIRMMPPVELQQVYAHVRRIVKEFYPPTS